MKNTQSPNALKIAVMVSPPGGPILVVPAASPIRAQKSAGPQVVAPTLLFAGTVLTPPSLPRVHPAPPFTASPAKLLPSANASPCGRNAEDDRFPSCPPGSEKSTSAGLRDRKGRERWDTVRNAGELAIGRRGVARPTTLFAKKPSKTESPPPREPSAEGSAESAKNPSHKDL
jgi:hypothetical protein